MNVMIVLVFNGTIAIGVVGFSFRIETAFLRRKSQADDRERVIVAGRAIGSGRGETPNVPLHPPSQAGFSYY